MNWLVMLMGRTGVVFRIKRAQIGQPGENFKRMSKSGIRDSSEGSPYDVEI
jgi:hypothetical protein